MIAFENHRILLFTPSKCGSTSLHKHFCSHKTPHIIAHQNFNNSTYVDKHTDFIPLEYDSFKKIIVVRNPYNRFISLWSHHQQWSMKNKNKIDMTFDQFIESVCGGEKSKDLFFFPISKRYKEIHFDDFWKIEKIDDHANQYKLENGKIPILNKSKKDYKQDLSTENKEMIYDFYKEDFLKFSYEK